MSDGRIYEITIRDKTEKNGKAPISGGETPTSDTKGREEKDPQAFKWISYKKVKPYIKRAMSYGISQINLRTGRAEEQQRWQMAMDIGSTAVSFVESAIMGATIGGPYGAAAAVGVQVLNEGINVALKMTTFNTRRDMENITLGLSHIRSGNSLIYTDGNR